MVPVLGERWNPILMYTNIDDTMYNFSIFVVLCRGLWYCRGTLQVYRLRCSTKKSEQKYCLILLTCARWPLDRPVACPTKGISIELEIWSKFAMLWFKMYQYSTDHKEILHTSRQWRVQNFVAIGWAYLNHSKFWTNWIEMPWYGLVWVGNSLSAW